MEDVGFWRKAEKLEWFQQVGSILFWASVAADLMEDSKAMVIVALGSGTDVALQVAYRVREGNERGVIACCFRSQAWP